MNSTNNKLTPEYQTIAAVEQLFPIRDSLAEHNFPELFLIELEEFVNRNALAKVDLNPHGKVPHCCPRCLKAHALKKAKQTGLDEQGLSLIQTLMGEHERGHHGHYLDEERLIEN